jgi:hypothetical protein
MKIVLRDKRRFNYRLVLALITTWTILLLTRYSTGFYKAILSLGRYLGS